MHILLNEIGTLMGVRIGKEQVLIPRHMWYVYLGKTATGKRFDSQAITRIGGRVIGTVGWLAENGMREIYPWRTQRCDTLL